MIRAIVWKEVREQGLIAATLMVLGGGVLVAAATLAEPPNSSAPPTDIIRFLGLGRLATLLLAVTAGMVCGGALFAAEREAGTMGFLEALPATRSRLWVAKLLAGFLLALSQIGIVLAIAGGFGQVRTAGFGVAVLVYSLLAFAWGTLGSTLARTTLGSVGFAIPSASLMSILILLPVLLLFGQPGTGWPRGEGVLIFLVSMFLTPLVLSGYIFMRPDRTRAGDDSVEAEWSANIQMPVRPGRSRLGLRATFWLSTRQLRTPALVCSAFALAFGFALLSPSLQPFVVWPLLGLTAGVVAGVLMFADEQGHRSASFWGEQRLPVTRMWLVKLAVHAAFAAWLAILLLFPSSTRSWDQSSSDFGRGPSFLSGLMRSLLFDRHELDSQGWKYLYVPVLYGFAAGHLCGMLFRKTVVAAGVAAVLAGTGAALWIPSMMAGGLAHWQVCTPPIVAFAVAGMLLRPWAADRMVERRPVMVLAGGLACVTLVQAVGISYRVIEVPDNPHGDADLVFIQALPPFDANESGRSFRMASERFSRHASQVSAQFDRNTTGSRTNRPEDRLAEFVLQLDGWPPAQGPKAMPELDRWMDELYQDRSAGLGDSPWFTVAEESSLRPVGMFEDPRSYTQIPLTSPLDSARRMAFAVLGRGLQLQARNGDHAAFVTQYRTVTALVQNLRNNSMVAAAQTGNVVERAALYACYFWLRNLPDTDNPSEREERERLLERMIRLNADSQEPFDPMPHLLAERYIKRGLMGAPGQWLPNSITPPGGAKESVNMEADLVGFAWTVPWERERTRRLVGLIYDSDYEGKTFGLVRGRPGAGYLLVRGATASDLIEMDRTHRVFRRAMTVVLATRLYHLRHGRFPDHPSELVSTGCLPAIPSDPFDDQPLRYRVSPGEALVPPRGLNAQTIFPTAFDLAPGQPVVWSVGPDKIDQGGKQHPALPGSILRQDDWVVVVPMPAQD